MIHIQNKVFTSVFRLLPHIEVTTHTFESIHTGLTYLERKPKRSQIGVRRLIVMGEMSKSGCIKYYPTYTIQLS
jgi:hypothetical protein